MREAILSEYIPECWYHPKGIRKVTARLEPRLPSVANALFLTFTVDPALYGNASSAFDHSRDRLRRIFHKLRKGIEWNGKFLKIDAPYCVKTEFHANGWAHFHVVFLTRRFLPGQLLNEIWRLGRTNVKRITNRDFRYLLKYVTKGGELPEWVKSRKRVRIFQSSHGFLKALEAKAAKEGVSKTRIARKSITIGERLKRWQRMAKLTVGEQVRICTLCDTFRNLFNRNVYAEAKDGRYLGRGKILITATHQFERWMLKTKEMETLFGKTGFSFEELLSQTRLRPSNARTTGAPS